MIEPAHLVPCLLGHLICKSYIALGGAALRLVMKSNSCHGLMVIDKPAGITSRDVVNRLQKAFPSGTRLGHTGTLDPLATGVLVICVGVATRFCEYVQRMNKTYQARLRLGARSETDDTEGAIAPIIDANPPQKVAVIQALQMFVGEIQQTPPVFSAAKVTGRRAYDLARAGKDVSLAARTVHIHTLDLLAYDYPWLDIEVRCGKGTYIRSLARDLGEHLGCGALVETLRRTQIGVFNLSQAHPLEIATLELSKHVLPLAWAVAKLPRVNLQPSEIAHIRQGRRVPRPASLAPNDLPTQMRELAAFDLENNLVAVVGVDDQQKTIFPLKVLPNSVLPGYT
jgi:tRNA pseudouridine55 synthase